MLNAFGFCLVIQITCTVVAFAGFRVGTMAGWQMAATFILISSFIFAFALKLMIDMQAKEAATAEREKYLTEREKLKVHVEQEKLKMVKDTHKMVSDEAKKASTKANLKVAMIAGGALVTGVVLIAAQMFWLGLLTLSTGAGGLGGYLIRMRQEKTSFKRRLTSEWVRADAAEPLQDAEFVEVLGHDGPSTPKKD